MTFQLRNPHSVMAALRRRPNDVLEVRVNADRPADAWGDVVVLAGEHNIPVRSGADRESGRRRTQRSPQTERIGAGEAKIREPSASSLDDVTSIDPELPNGLWIALDCVQDPQNVGSIFRSAAFFGVRGIIVSKDRSAPMNATVCDVSAGGMESVPFAIVPNLRGALQTAKKNGLWILGTSEHATADASTIDRQRPWLMVLGNEQNGMRRLTTETCDELCRLTSRGDVGSLNVAVAAGALMAILTSD